MLASLLIAPLALASGLDAPQVGSGLSGLTTADPAAAFHNPARLAGLRTPAIQLGLGGVFGRLGYTRDRRGTYPRADGLVFDVPVAPEDLDPSRTGEAAPVGATIAAPTADLYVGGPIRGTPVALGGGIGVPYAAPLRFPFDGAQRFALQQAFIAVADASLSLAVRAHERVEIGVGGAYLGGVAEIARQQDFGALDLLSDILGNPTIDQANAFGSGAPTDLREQDVLARDIRLRRAVAHGGTFRVGIHTRPHDRLHLSAAFDYGARMVFRGPFALDLNDPFFTADLAAQGLVYPARVDGRGALAFRLPMRIRAGMTVVVSERVRLDVLAEGVLWSGLQAFDLTLTSPDLALPDLGVGDTVDVSIPRRWRDSVHVEVRPVVQAADGVELGVTVGYHSPASPDATIDVASPDGHRLIAGVAAAITRGRVTILPDVEIQGIVPRTVTTSDFDLGNGTYRLWLAGVGLRLRVGFGAED